MNKDDNWLVIGPVRTGSKVIVDVIRHAGYHHGIDIDYIAPDNHTAVVSPRTIKHSHNIEDFRAGYNTCILSTRNCIDSAISRCIQPNIGQWHLYQRIHADILDKITPFVLDPEVLIGHYQDTRAFYDAARGYLSDSIIKIDYSEFRDTPAVLLKRLSLDENTPLPFLPVKNPGQPWDWIINWNEIQDVIKHLSPDPF